MIIKVDELVEKVRPGDQTAKRIVEHFFRDATLRLEEGVEVVRIPWLGTFNRLKKKKGKNG
jgi:hypothetical protein